MTMALKVFLMVVAVGCLGAAFFSDVSPSRVDYVILAILIFNWAFDEDNQSN